MSRFGYPRRGAIMAMGFGVFIHRSDSIYDDSPAERYQFPSQYLGRVKACVGDWIVYYEPKKVVDTRGYFAVAKIQQVIPDPKAPGMHLALIEPGSYLDFANPVPFNDAAGPVERGVLNEQWAAFRSCPIRGAADLAGRFQAYCGAWVLKKTAPLLPRLGDLRAACWISRKTRRPFSSISNANAQVSRYRGLCATASFGGLFCVPMTNAAQLPG